MVFHENLLGSNMTTWILIASVIFLILGITRMGKSKRVGRTFLWIGVIGLGVTFVLPALGFDFSTLLGGQTQPLAIPPTAQPTPQPKTTLCPVEDTTVTLSGENAFTGVASGGTHRYRINGNPALTVADAGTFTASPGDVLDILWMNGSATAGYLGDTSLGVAVPCDGTFTASKKLYQNGSLTIRVYSEDDGDLLTASGSVNESVADGDVANLKLEVQGQFERGWGKGGIVIVEYNRTALDDVIVQLGGSVTSVPVFYTITNTFRTAKAYTFPPILNNEIKTGTVVLDADDTNSPAGWVGAEVNMTFVPYSYFINDDVGGRYDLGVEDEDSVRVYQSQAVFNFFTN